MIPVFYLKRPRWKFRYSDDGYVRALAQGMFGIGDVVFVKAENLDIFGSDVNKIMSDAKKEIEGILKTE